ncbi:MAG: ribonuclease E/G [Eubacteriales bacterium]|nr:ribonuclease E/G [Eubacteriales bacterium]
MPDSLFILVKAEGTSRKIAVTDKGKLLEYYVENGDESTLVNAIFVGRVENVSPGVKAAFVHIGQPLNGFLPLTEMESFQTAEGEKPLVSGEEIIVQVKKDARDQKGAFLTRDIALPGQYIIYMPFNRYVGVSKRVTEECQRERLTELGRELADGTCGLIMRAGAMDARRDEMAEELAGLASQWEKMQQKAVHLKAPATLYREPSALTALVRDYAPRYELSVTVNNAVNRMPSPEIGLLWGQVSDIELDAAWRSSTVDQQLADALGRRLELNNGGTLVIDEREALTTVDVNSGKYIGEKNSDLALTQNLTACAEIARQLRLRNIGGIILIDFIDMRTDAERAQVTSLLIAQLSHDRGKTVVHGFTKLGLLEMTRKRTGTTLREALQTPCNVCHGTGYRPIKSTSK